MKNETLKNNLEREGNFLRRRTTNQLSDRQSGKSFRAERFRFPSQSANRQCRSNKIFNLRFGRKNDYLYTNYNLAATFLERISNNGVIGHAGILNQLDQIPMKENYFSDWGLSGLQAGKDEKGKNLIHFQTFNFGAKVPVVTAITAKGDGGGEIVNYENIGIRITRFNLPENTPTIIGSLATPKTDEFIFLILTVRPV